MFYRMMLLLASWQSEEGKTMNLQNAYDTLHDLAVGYFTS
jgi:hypothetical protein